MVSVQGCGWFPVLGLLRELVCFASPECVHLGEGPRSHHAGAMPGSGDAEPVSHRLVPTHGQLLCCAGGRGVTHVLKYK